MATRKAEYRFRNGSVWDTLYFKTLAEQVDKNGVTLNKLVFSTFFGVKPNADFVNAATSYVVPWNAGCPGMTVPTDYASLESSGRIKILKPGLYFIYSNISMTDMTTLNFIICAIEATIEGVSAPIAAANSDKNYGQAMCSMSGVAYLNASDTVQTIITKENNSNGYRIGAARSSMGVVPLYIP